ncbi:hypothetical protein EWM64_g5343 [Hericium alpestre]|uniref:CSN8/PSMD8/EIF3K domain-containing protein n=1 Tax=Hericium alpestre TaxID=135208 RepID=A0A4Y9ZWX6_9AGAM|nr:hypothetical protein EWM64_g5343 [Hericium alpestre]
MPNQQLPSSPPNKPRSPPQLLIPEGQEQAPPMINAPEGDGGVGPRLHIVPATPVGGSDPNQGHSNPFGQGSRQSASTAWQHDPSTSNAAQSSSYQPSFTFPAERPLINTGGNGGLPSSADDFLLPPSPSRIRSKSDTSARPPQWLGSSGMSLLSQNTFDDRTHTINLGDADFASVLAGLTTAFVDAFRRRTLALVSRAYTSIPLELAQAYLGLPKDQLLSAAEANKWTYDASTHILTPVLSAQPVSTSFAISAPSSLHTLDLVTDSVAQLET